MMRNTISCAFATGLAGLLAVAVATPSHAQSSYHAGQYGYHSDDVGHVGPVRAGAGLAAGAVGTGVELATGAVGTGLGIAGGVARAATAPFTGATGYGADPYSAYASAGPAAGAVGAYAGQPMGSGCWVATDMNRGYGYVGTCGTARKRDIGLGSISGQMGTQGTILPYPTGPAW